MASIPVEFHTTYSLDEHMDLIRAQVDKSLQDPETRQLAVKIVSAKYEWRSSRHPRSGRTTDVPMIKAWGQWFLAPDMPQCEPRDEQCELERIWEFVVLNARYVYDPEGVDFFATAKETLLAGGGDCDDLTILIDSLGKSIGFKAAARVISVPEAPDEWSHVFPLLGMCSKDDPQWWVPLDASVTGSRPGWQYEDIARYRDFAM